MRLIYIVKCMCRLNKNVEIYNYFVYENNVWLRIVYERIEYLYLLKILFFGWKKLIVKKDRNVNIKWVGGIIVKVEIYYIFIVDLVNVMGCSNRSIKNIVD